MHSKSVATVNSQECEAALRTATKVAASFSSKFGPLGIPFHVSKSKEFTTEMTSVLLAIFCAVCL